MDQSTRHKNRMSEPFRPKGMMPLDALYTLARCHKAKKEGGTQMNQRDKLLNEIRIRLDLLSVEDLNVVYNVILALRRRE